MKKRALVGRTTWEWRRCPRRGATETCKWGSYQRRPWFLSGRQTVAAAQMLKRDPALPVETAVARVLGQAAPGPPPAVGQGSDPGQDAPPRDPRLRPDDVDENGDVWNPATQPAVPEDDDR